MCSILQNWERVWTQNEHFFIKGHFQWTKSSFSEIANRQLTSQQLRSLLVNWINLFTERLGFKFRFFLRSWNFLSICLGLTASNVINSTCVVSPANQYGQVEKKMCIWVPTSNRSDTLMAPTNVCHCKLTSQCSKQCW